MPSAKLDPRYRHWADLHLAGRDQPQIAEVAGVNGSTVSRALRRPEVLAYIERKKSQQAKAASAAPASPTTLQDLNFSSLARGAAATAYSRIRQRLAAGEEVPTSELVRIADGLRKFSEEDTSGTSPAAIAAALTDDKALAEVVGALAPAAGQRLWEALSGRLEGDLGLDTPDVRTAFQYAEVLLTETAAAAWTHRWRPVIALMKQDAARLEAWAKHVQVADQHGDEPDAASVDAVYGGVEPTDRLLSAASAITQETTDAP